MSTTSPAKDVLRSAQGSVETDYVRLALFAVGNGKAPCVTLRMPSMYLEAVLRAVLAEYPTSKSRILVNYRGHAKVCLWLVPEVGDVDGPPTDVSGTEA